MARLIALLLATLAFAAPVNAGKKPPTLTIGPSRSKTTLERVKLELFPDTRRTRVLLTLAISTQRTEQTRTRDNELDLMLPDTARVVGLALFVGKRPRLAAKLDVACVVSAACSDRNTWQRFVTLEHANVDTALLRFGYSVDGIAHYVLHHARLVPGAPVTIEIELELRPARQLDVASAWAVADYVVEIDSVAQQVKPLPAKYKAQRIGLPKPKPHDLATDRPISDPVVARGVSLLVHASTSSQPKSP